MSHPGIPFDPDGGRNLGGQLAKVSHMGDEDDSTQRAERIASAPEPPYQALLPNFNKVTRSSFAKGTVSRRRINHALLVLALITLTILGVVFVPQIING